VPLYRTTPAPPATTPPLDEPEPQCSAALRLYVQDIPSRTAAVATEPTQADLDTGALRPAVTDRCDPRISAAEGAFAPSSTTQRSLSVRLRRGFCAVSARRHGWDRPRRTTSSRTTTRTLLLSDMAVAVGCAYDQDRRGQADRRGVHLDKAGSRFCLSTGNSPHENRLPRRGDPCPSCLDIDARRQAPHLPRKQNLKGRQGRARSTSAPTFRRSPLGSWGLISPRALSRARMMPPITRREAHHRAGAALHQLHPGSGCCRNWA
jgi:hypothetical protein